MASHRTSSPFHSRSATDRISQHERMELEMKRKITVFMVLASSAAALFAAALGGASSAWAAAASRGARVALGKTALGRVLVDARGRTLYLFEKDTHGRSACYGACAAYWPPRLQTVR